MYSTGQIIVTVIVIILVMSLFYLFAVFLRWILGIHILVSELKNINKQLSDAVSQLEQLNKKGKDMTVLLDSIDRAISGRGVSSEMLIKKT